MPTFTSSLPKEVLDRLSNLSSKLNVPKNKIINIALDQYLEQLERRLYHKSYRNIADDPEILDIAEEGMEDYVNQLIDWDEER